MIRHRRVSPLKLEILKRGFVQADVAQTAGVGESRLSRILNGRAEPEDWEIKQIAHALDIARDEVKDLL